MIMFRRVGCLAALLLSLSACGTWMDMADRTPKRLSVQTWRAVAEYKIPGGADGLDESGYKALEAFLAEHGVIATDRLYVVPPQGESQADPATRALRARLAEMGFDVAAPEPGLAKPSRDGLTVVVRRYVVVPPANCPDFSGTPGISHTNLPSSNFGCADQTNLGLMIANPGDLVRGHELEPEDGVNATNTIQRYRQHQTTPLPAADTSTKAN